MRLPALQLAIAPLALLVSFTEIDCSSTTGIGRFLFVRGEPADPPPADSPSGVVRLLEWCWNQRDLESYREVFTGDFRFVFGILDEYGNAYRDTPWTREDELAMFGHLVHGDGANQPPAASITLVLDRNFNVADDPRPGKDPRWHRFIRTSVLLRVIDAGGFMRECSGFANFFVARGDSALIPPDLVARGFGPDPSRWYVERWEDDTTGDAGVRALPTSKPTWGSIKALYR